MDRANNNIKLSDTVPSPSLLCPMTLTCSASLGSGWCICSALLPALSCAPAAAANSCCSQAQLPDRLLLRPGRSGSRSRGCATRSCRASSSTNSRGPMERSWFCWSRDADCRVTCPSWRRDGEEREEEEEEEKGGGDGDGPEAATAGTNSRVHK